MFNYLLLTIVIVVVFVRQLNALTLLFGDGWLRQKKPSAGIQKQKQAGKKQNKATRPTKRPPCPACLAEQEAQAVGKTSPSKPPPKLEREPGQGRPRSVDTSSHFCPCEMCAYYGWVGLENIRVNGHPNGGRWRQLQCIVCNKYFMETKNMI